MLALERKTGKKHPLLKDNAKLSKSHYRLIDIYNQIKRCGDVNWQAMSAFQSVTGIELSLCDAEAIIDIDQTLRAQHGTTSSSSVSNQRHYARNSSSKPRS